MVCLETERLLLRNWEDNDFHVFARMCADEKVMEFFPFLLNKEASDELAGRLRSTLIHDGWGLWAVEEKMSKHFIGFIGLEYVAPDLHFYPAIEISWRLAFPFWGKGYATEGARAALQFGFETLNTEEIVSFTALINLRSQNVMKKLGMTLSETFNHPRLAASHRLCTHMLYRINRKSWASQADDTKSVIQKITEK